MSATTDMTGKAPPDTVSAPEAPQARRRRPGLVPLVRRLHFYGGIFVAPFLLAAARTGLIHVLAPQTDRVAYHDQLYASNVGIGRLPVIEQVRRAEATAPAGSSLAYVILPAEQDKTTRVVFKRPAPTGAARARSTSIRTAGTSRAASTPGSTRRRPSPGPTTCTATCTAERSAGTTARSDRHGSPDLVAAPPDPRGQDRSHGVSHGPRHLAGGPRLADRACWW